MNDAIPTLKRNATLRLRNVPYLKRPNAYLSCEPAAVVAAAEAALPHADNPQQAQEIAELLAGAKRANPNPKADFACRADQVLLCCDLALQAEAPPPLATDNPPAEPTAPAAEEAEDTDDE